jgi:hypothetical protein
MEDEEALKSCALVSQFSDSVQHKVNDLFANSVMSSSIIVSCVFLSGDQLFWVEQLSVSSSSHFVDDSWFEVNEHSAGDMFASPSLREKSAEGVITNAHSLVTRHLAIWLDSMLKAVQLPTSITDLDSGLSNMD